MITYLPVSIGEALDKLSILDIKKRRIQDSRKNDVIVEYNKLFEYLKDYISKYSNIYDRLIKINEQIWDDMTILHENTTMDHLEYGILCRKVIMDNDIRFRLKNKINMLLSSGLKEQKGYAIKEFIVDYRSQEPDFEKIFDISLNYDVLKVKLDSNVYIPEFIKIDTSIMIEY